MPFTDEEIPIAKALLAGDLGAFERGAAPLLLRALDRPVLNAVVADRAPAYVTILHGLLLRRHEHELEPLHEDLERLLAPALAEVEPARDDQALARDLDALAGWGCLERLAEPLKIRGYKDQRRERFRYRLTDDAVALLAWLAARLEARLEGRTDDGRDLLVDVLGQLRELCRIVGTWHRGERLDGTPRRAIYLLNRVEERVQAITEELLAFRAGMLAFSSRPYDLAQLHAILAWLERYVTIYLAGVRTLGAEIGLRVDELSQPRFLRALAEHQAILGRERAETPAAFRAGSTLRDPREILAQQAGFFAARGRLAELCARIDESARAVLRKMHRHLREIERRSARLSDLRARISEIAAMPAAPAHDGLAAFANALVASAHARFAQRGGFTDGRVPPPLPRKHAAPDVDRSRRPPLRPKQAPAETVRQLRARRLAELRSWVHASVLRGESEARLSEAAPGGPAAPRRWLDVARARHLDRGKDLVALGITVAGVAGEARIGGEGERLDAPDCLVRATS